MKKKKIKEKKVENHRNPSCRQHIVSLSSVDLPYFDVCVLLMNLVAVFCYVTLACDNSTSQRVQLTVNRNSTFAANRSTNSPPNPIPNQTLVPTVKPKSAPIPWNLNSVQTSANRKTAVSGDGRKRETAMYPTRYDYIDVEAVLSNERIIKVLFNCVMNRGPCTREGLELKSKHQGFSDF